MEPEWPQSQHALRAVSRLQGLMQAAKATSRKVFWAGGKAVSPQPRYTSGINLIFQHGHNLFQKPESRIPSSDRHEKHSTLSHLWLLAWQLEVASSSQQEAMPMSSPCASCKVAAA